MTQELKTLFVRDLNRLSKEIEVFDNDNLWVLNERIPNTAGNLAIHICGNLQHFVGHIIGGTDYVRNRPYEFSAKGIAKETIQEEIRTSIEIIEQTLDHLTHDQLAAQYRPEVLGYPMTATHFLIHLYGHLNYHLGQINYARRII